MFNASARLIYPASVNHVGARRRVAVFGLGGTIAMSTAEAGGVAPALTAAQLLASVPGLAETGIDVAVRDFRNVPSASLSFADIHALGAAFGQVRDVDGIVVTQGTDTVEETSYLVELAYQSDIPIVFTGAMRNPTLAGADGPANLLAAVVVAADPHAHGHGTLVVFADEIHAARRVRKTHTASTATFRSPDGGPLGYVVEGKPRWLNRIGPGVRVATPPVRDVRVGLVTATLGDDAEVLAAVAERVDGLVMAAFGAGHVPETLVGPLEKAAAAIPVVLASRTDSGPALTHTYGFPGSERDLLARGLIPAGFLGPIKARILLHTLLAAGADRSAISEMFIAAGQNL